MVRVIRKVSTLIQPTSIHHIHPNYQNIGQTVIRAPQWKKVNSVRSWNLARLGRSYTRFTITRPFLSSSVTGLTLLSLADVFAQFCSSSSTSSFEWNRRRTLGMAAFGMLYYGTVLKSFYIAYDVVIGSGTLWQACAKTFVDLFVNSPFFLLPMYYGISCAVQGYSKEETKQKIETEFMNAWLGTIGFWLPGCTVNFYLVPPAYRVLFIASLSFLHKTWLSWFANKEQSKATIDSSINDKSSPLENLSSTTTSPINTNSIVEELTLPNFILNQENDSKNTTIKKSINFPKITIPSAVMEHAI